MTPVLATLNPMMTLILCISVGFVLSKLKILPDGASRAMAKMELWVFCPALSFTTMMRFCTVESIGEHLINIVLSSVGVAFAVMIAVFLSRFFIKDKSSPERGVYTYALAFANGGYMGDPIVLNMFGEVALAYYKLFYLPFSLLINSWGISILTPSTEGKGQFWRRLINAPTISMLVGIAVGLSGIGKYIPVFVVDSLDLLKSCMGPVAMLLVGATIAKYDLPSMLKKKKVYVATALRLFVLPVLMVSFTYGLKSLANVWLGLDVGNDVLFLMFFATATPLGLNTVIFPEAYGQNPETGASMAMISHAFCAISIPILYTLMVMIFGTPFQ